MWAYCNNVGLRLAVGCLVACACNAQLHLGGQVDAAAKSPEDAPLQVQGDAAPDAMIPLGPWSTPQPVPGASTTALDEDDPTLSSTATEMYFAAGNPKQLYLMTRPSPTGTWTAPALATDFNAAGAAEESPRLSPDDLTIYFGRNGDIYSSTRPTVGGAWSAPAPVASVNTANYEKWLAVCDGDHYMVSRGNGAQQDLYQGTLGDAGTAVAVLDSTSSEISTFLSTDCLTVYFASNRSGQTQMYTSTRATVGSEWVAPTLVDTFGTATDNEDAWISPDTRTFVFATIRGGGTTKDIYLSTR